MNRRKALLSILAMVASSAIAEEPSVEQSILDRIYQRPPQTIFGFDDTILAFGDSITKGYGVNRIHTFHDIIRRTLTVKIVDDAEHGRTSTQAKDRIEDALRSTKPTWVIIAIGGNDMLRAVPDWILKENLKDIIAAVRQYGAKPALVAVPYPRRQEDNPAYREVAIETNVPLLEGLGKILHPKNDFLKDGIHPNPSGHQKIADALIRFFAVPELPQQPAP